MERKAFLDQEPPPGYIAGIGRGATGFTTSADTAIQRPQPGFLIQEGNENDEEVDGTGYEEENEDGLLVSKAKDKEDEEADRIYEEIDRRLRSRNRRKPKELTVLDNDPIKEQFSDLKRELSTVSEEEWANLPDVGDMTKRNKRARILEQQQRRFYAVPDNVIAGAGSMGKVVDNETTNFQSISEAKDRLLSKQLDSLIPKSASVNEELHDDMIAESDGTSDSQIADIKKGRLILSSLRKTDPYKANSWIASARLEGQAKNFSAAKNLIVEGCRKNPHNEDVWLENIRIHLKSSESNKFCKLIVTEALKFNSKSEKLWLKAFDLENSSDIISRRRVLMKALEFIPLNTTIWKELINLEENPDDVQKLLRKAVEFCPQEWEFWLTLINLSEYQEAKSLLNQARKSMNDNFKVWITALKLEERENESISSQKLVKLLEKGLRELERNAKDKSTLLTTRQWLDEAANAESEGFNKSCKAIVINSLQMEASSEDNETLKNWFNEANYFTSKGNFETTNFIYQFIIDKFPNNIECWTKLIYSLKQTSDQYLDKLYEYYEQAINLNPEIEIFPLMYAKDKWLLSNEIARARKILEDANKRLPDSESIWLARVKLEVKTFNYKEANEISSELINTIPDSSPRIWYKHIHLQRFLNRKQPDESYQSKIINLANDALERFPNCEKLFLQKGQILLHDLNKPELAREVCSIGVKKCPTSVKLWIQLAQIDEKYLKILIRARSVLDTAILKNPQSDALWDQKIKLERRNDDIISARQITNKALKLFPNSALLWIQSLLLIPKMSQRKNAFLDALKNTNNSPLILLQIGIFFWLDGKFLKARSWFERALNSDKLNGDIWGWLNYFIIKHGTDEVKQDLINKFKESFEDINKGDIWNSVKKDIDNFEKSPIELLELVTEKLVTTSTTI